jgi:2-polyprenyl-3-methyl-5-hydroxy-6-metoxy-1,4-benzoquinol methylase
MDLETLKSYDARAATYARDWLEQDAPIDMYELLTRFFRKGPTVDIGCGAGRDAAWLAANGFDVSGFDASENLLDEARAAYPQLSFKRALLPALDGVERGAYENVLCETVIMHLEPKTVPSATSSLLELLRPGGTLYLSWRVTEDVSQRDKNGRLYPAFDRQIVLDAILKSADVLVEQDIVSVSSGKRIERVLARKRGL